MDFMDFLGFVPGRIERSIGVAKSHASFLYESIFLHLFIEWIQRKTERVSRVLISFGESTEEGGMAYFLKVIISYIREQGRKA